jgi:hypothetical protein
MGGTCSIEDIIMVAKPEGKKPLGKLDLRGSLIFCLVLKKEDGRT